MKKILFTFLILLSGFAAFSQSTIGSYPVAHFPIRPHYRLGVWDSAHTYNSGAHTYQLRVDSLLSWVRSQLTPASEPATQIWYSDATGHLTSDKDFYRDTTLKVTRIKIGALDLSTVTEATFTATTTSLSSTGSGAQSELHLESGTGNGAYMWNKQDGAGGCGVIFNVGASFPVSKLSVLQLGDGSSSPYFRIFNGGAWTWPTTDGSNGNALVTDGSGNLSFGSPSIDTSACNPKVKTDSVISCTGNQYVGAKSGNYTRMEVHDGDSQLYWFGRNSDPLDYPLAEADFSAEAVTFGDVNSAINGAKMNINVASEVMDFGEVDTLFKINLDSNIAYFKNLNVGVGTSTPVAKLHVSIIDTTGNPDIFILDVPGQGQLFVQNSAAPNLVGRWGDIDGSHNGTTISYVDARSEIGLSGDTINIGGNDLGRTYISNNTGIGTPTPAEILTVSSATSGIQQINTTYNGDVTSYVLKVHLTAAQIQTANSVPIDIGLPASGLGYYYKITSADFNLSGVTISFTSTNLYIGFPGAPDYQVTALNILSGGNIFTTLPLNASTDTCLSDNNILEISTNDDSILGDGSGDVYIKVDKVKL